MKKLLIAFISLILLSGCSSNNKNVVGEIEKNINSLDNYHLTGDLLVHSKEEKYSYSVDVTYKKNNYYKVSLKNKDNSHEQIVLKNEEGVYIITPSLNKSFKFQSQWPNNSSQTYILESILKDIKSDEERTIVKKDDCYEIVTNVNYPNNSELVSQIIKVDQSTMLPKEVYVKNKDNNISIEMKITKIDTKTKYNKEYFSLSSNVKTEEIETKETASLDSVVYPMYLPVGTSYQKEELVKAQDSERIILTYTGSKPFVLIEEPAKASSKHQTLEVNAELVFYENILGVMSSSTLNWIEGSREYYLIGEDLEENELLKIASSTSTVPITK